MFKQIYPGPTAIPQADIDAYLAGPGAYDASKGWEMCMNEYWKATYLNHHEAWFNWRRTGYPKFIDSNNNSTECGKTSDGIGVPRKLLYPEKEKSSNPNCPTNDSIYDRLENDPL